MLRIKHRVEMFAQGSFSADFHEGIVVTRLALACGFSAIVRVLV